MKIHIPFYSRFKKPMLDETKTLTSRTKKYGKPRDTFEAFGAEFILLAIEEHPLSFVAEHWREEGCSSKQDFIDVWNKIHSWKGFIPNWIVQVHIFKKLDRKPCGALWNPNEIIYDPKQQVVAIPSEHVNCRCQITLEAGKTMVFRHKTCAKAKTGLFSFLFLRLFSKNKPFLWRL